MKNKILMFFLIIVIFCAFKNNEQNIFIPSSSIRLRVIPNSNNPRDINIKEQVKTYLEENVYNITKDANDINTARNIISKSIPEIETNINNIFINNEYPLSYKVNFGYNYFPEKIYKGIRYDEGYYESLVIAIGEANGDNWWCVLFPNFCLVDAKESHEYRSYFKEIISKYSKKK